MTIKSEARTYKDFKPYGATLEPCYYGGFWVTKED